MVTFEKSSLGWSGVSRGVTQRPWAIRVNGAVVRDKAGKIRTFGTRQAASKWATKNLPNVPQVRKFVSSSNTEGRAYEKDGVWHWESNNSVITVSTCKDYLIPCDPIKQEEAYQAHLDRVLADYRAQQPSEPSAEEAYEMRAAFGAGATVVDVISGRTFTTGV